MCQNEAARNHTRASNITQSDWLELLLIDVHYNNKLITHSLDAISMQNTMVLCRMYTAPVVSHVCPDQRHCIRIRSKINTTEPHIMFHLSLIKYSFVCDSYLQIAEAYGITV
jgi:hypothetical protein